MLSFLYISMFVGILFIVFYLTIKYIKISRKYKDVDDEVYYKKLYRAMFKGLLIAACIGCFICFIFPPAVWVASKKEVAISDRIDDQEPLVALPQNSKAYIGKKIENNIQYYIVNVGDSRGNDTILQLDSSSVEIGKVGKGQAPVYEKVSLYNIKKINHSGFISDSVNDMYANVYLDTSHAKFVKQITRLLISNDTQIVEYKN